MARREHDALYVMAAAYDDTDAAIGDYVAVKALYRAVRSSHGFDASVFVKDETTRARPA